MQDREVCRDTSVPRIDIVTGPKLNACSRARGKPLSSNITIIESFGDCEVGTRLVIVVCGEIGCVGEISCHFCVVLEFEFYI